MNVQKRGRIPFIIAFLTPACLLYGLFVVYPLLQSFVFAFYRWRGVSQSRKFVGLQNFNALAADDAFLRALKNGLWLLVVGGICITVLALLIAHAMQGAGRMARTLRSLYLFPQVISMVVVAILWTFIYNPSFGLLTGALKGLGLKSWVQPWLGTSHTALPAVGVAFLWYSLGFYIMLFSAGLRAIPAEVTEAAELDGSTGLHRFRRVTWPMLWSIKRVAAIYIVINVLNVFALVYLMTQGGPDRATEMPLTYLYEQAFTNHQFGYATALATVNFVIAMLLAGLVLLIFRRNPEAVPAS